MERSELFFGQFSHGSLTLNPLSLKLNFNVIIEEKAVGGNVSVSYAFLMVYAACNVLSITDLLKKPHFVVADSTIEVGKRTSAVYSHSFS